MMHGPKNIRYRAMLAAIKTIVKYFSPAADRNLIVRPCRLQFSPYTPTELMWLVAI